MKLKKVFWSLFYLFSSVWAWTPMEPARKTMVILVHGLNPPKVGLFKEGKCSYHANAADNHFEANGLTNYARKNLAGTVENVFLQSFIDPSLSPQSLAEELGNRSFSTTITCDGKEIIREVINGKIVEQNGSATNLQYEVKSVFENALRNWFAEQLLLVSASAETGERDFQTQKWIMTFTAAKGRQPTYAEFLADPAGRLLLPARFIIMAHSMGGLDSREYIHSTYYAGDVDKIITFDTPHEGSQAAEINIQLNDNYTGKFIMDMGIAALRGLVGLGLTIEGKGALEMVGAFYLWELAAFTSIKTLYELGIKLGGPASGYSDEYGVHLDGNKYIAGGAKRILKQNKLSTNYSTPSFRIFHLEGLPSPSEQEDYRDVRTDAIFPKFLLGILDNLLFSEGKGAGYQNIPWNQQLGNVVFASLMGGITGVNFSEQGTIVVPAYSSKGEGVALLQNPTTDIKRHLFSIDNSENTGLQIVGLGFLATSTYYTYTAINAASLLPGMAFVRFTKPAIGIGLITASGLLTAAPSWPNWFISHDYATINSQTEKIKTPHEVIVSSKGTTRSIQPSLLEDFIYEPPYASLVMSPKSSEVADVGLIDKVGNKSEVLLAGLSEINYKAYDWQGKMSVKTETMEEVGSSGSFVRRVKRYLMPEITAKDFPAKFLFTVDDYRPDLMALIEVQFNYSKFKLEWERQPNGNYIVQRYSGSPSKWTKVQGPLAEGEFPTPIDNRGNWNLMPGDFLDPDQNLSDVYNDGVNAISITMVNHAGYSNTQKFMVLLAFAPPIIDVSWPPLNSILSNPFSPLKVTINGQKYPGTEISIAGTQFKLFRDADDGVQTPYLNFDTPPTTNPTEALHFQHLWKNPPSPFLEQDGPYILQIKTETVRRGAINNSDGTKTALTVDNLIRRVPITIDRIPPKFNWTYAPNPLQNNSLAVLTYKWEDAPHNFIQGGRIRLQSADGLTTYHEFNPLGMASRGSGSVILPNLNLADGIYRLTIEGRDAALPDSNGLEQVKELFSHITNWDPTADHTRFNTLWDVMKSRKIGNTPAFNFNSASSTLIIDNTPPIFNLTSYKSVVSANNNQVFNYHVYDSSINFIGQTVDLNWKFRYSSAEKTQPRPFTFQESRTIKLGRSDSSDFSLAENVDGIQFKEDGLYLFTTKVVDMAGNSFESAEKSFIVDRTAPVISDYFTDRNTYSLDMVPKLEFKISEIKDVPYNQKGQLANLKIFLTDPNGHQEELTMLPPTVGSNVINLTRANVKGVWTVRTVVSDIHGNKSEDSKQFAIAAMPTVILSPNGLRETISGKVAIIGLAGNPSFNGKKFGYYELKYKQLNGPWLTGGITTPIGNRGSSTPAFRSEVEQTTPGILGTWDVTGLAGEYTLSLTSYQDQNSMDTLAHLVEVYVSPAISKSEQFSVSLENFPTDPYIPPTKNFKFDVRLTAPRGSANSANAYTLPTYKAHVEMRDSLGNVLYVNNTHTLTPSIFEGEPTDRSADGYYLWYNPENGWHLEVRNAPESAEMILNFYGQKALNADCRVRLSCDNCENRIQCIENETITSQTYLPTGEIIPFNRTLGIKVAKGHSGYATWNLPPNTKAGLIAKRKFSDEELSKFDPKNPVNPFLPANKFFLGANKISPYLSMHDPIDKGEPNNDMMPVLAIPNIPTSLQVSWNGLRVNSAYPAGGPAKVFVDVYPISEGKIPYIKARQIRSAEKSFKIEYLPIVLNAKSTNSTLFFQKNSPLSRITFEYDLHWRDAWLTAGIREKESQRIIHNFFIDKQHVASAQTYNLTWDGLGEGGLVPHNNVQLEFFIEGRTTQPGDPKRTIDASASTTFSVVYHKFVEADLGLMNLQLDTNDILGRDEQMRPIVAARPEFLFEAPVFGEIQGTPTFSYQVDYRGDGTPAGRSKQMVFGYPKDRFSLFVRRKREEIKVQLVGRMRLSKTGEKGFWGWIGGYYTHWCNDQAPEVETKFFSELITFKPGEEIRLPQNWALSQSNATNWGYEGNYATYLHHSLDFFILPQSEAIDINNIDTTRPKPLPIYDAYFEEKKDKSMLKFENISFSANHYSYPGYKYDPAQQNWFAKWKHTGYDAQGRRLPYAYWNIDNSTHTWMNFVDGQSECDNLAIDPSKDDSKPLVDNGKNGVWDKGDQCANGVSFDPDRKLLQVRFEARNKTNNQWAHNTKFPKGECNPDGGRREFSYDLILRVPEEYWNPPAGVNNLANRFMRMDPLNKFLYDPKDGYFKNDEYDNLSYKLPGNTQDYITPFHKHRFMWQRYLNRTGDAEFRGDPTDLKVKITEGLKSQLNHPLSFGNEDHSLNGLENFEIGFASQPQTGGDAAGSRFRLRIYEEQCKNRVCTGNKVLIKELNSRDNIWSSTNKSLFTLKPLYTEPQWGLGHHLFANKYHFEIDLQVKPNYLQLANPGLRTVKLDWPLTFQEFKSAQENFENANEPKFLHASASGIRWGINDGIVESKPFPDNWIDTAGYLNIPLPLEAIDPLHVLAPNTYTTGEAKKNFYEKLTKDSGTFIDSIHFNKGKYFGDQSTFGDFLDVKWTLSASKGITSNFVDSNMKFTGNNKRDWLSSHDFALNKNNGKLKARLLFNKDLKQMLIPLDSIYKLSIGNSATTDLSLYHKNNDIFTLNDSLTNIRIGSKGPVPGIVDTILLRYPNGDIHNTLFPSNPEIELPPNPGPRFNLQINKTYTYKSEPEFIGLYGYATMPYEVAYIDKNGHYKTIFGNNPQSQDAMRISHNLGWLDIKQLQGNTSFFLVSSDTNSEGNRLYKKLDLKIGTPVTADSIKVVSSIHGNASVRFSAGDVSSKQYVTVRVRSIEETPLLQDNQLTPIGPVVSIEPSMSFPNGHRPQVSIRIDRTTINASGSNLDNLKIYKPDGENLIALEDHLYTMYYTDGSTCNYVVGGSPCRDNWEAVSLTASTSSFSHFTVLDSVQTRTQPINLFLTPAKGSQTLRRLKINGLASHQFDLKIAYDLNNNGKYEQDEINPLVVSRWINSDPDSSEAEVLISSKGPFEIRCIPHLNAKISTVQGHLYDSLVFHYNGAPELITRGDGNKMLFSLEVNQPGILSIQMYRGTEVFSQVQIPLEGQAHHQHLVEWDGYNPLGTLDEGSFQTLLEFTGMDNQSLRIAGPVIIVDKTPPEAHLVGKVIVDTNIQVTLQAQIFDKLPVAAEYYHAWFNGQTVGTGSFGPKVTESQQTQTFSIPSEMISSCKDCALTVEYNYRDHAGWTGVSKWTSPPIYLYTSDTLLVSGLRAEKPLFQVWMPITVDSTKLPALFHSISPDASDLYFTDLDGHRLEQKLDFIDRENKRLLVWLLIPKILPGRETSVLIHWAKTVPPFSNLETDIELAGHWSMQSNQVEKGLLGSEPLSQVSYEQKSRGILGDAVDFTGNGYLQISDSFAMDSLPGYSMGVWVKPGKRIDSIAQVLFTKGLIQIHSGTAGLFLRVDKSTYPVPYSKLRVGEWAQVSLVHEATSGINTWLYINGKPVLSLSIPNFLLLAHGPTHLGAASAGWRGSFDELQIAYRPWNSELVAFQYITQKDAAGLWKKQPTLKYPPKNIHWVTIYTNGPQLANNTDLRQMPFLIHLDTLVYPNLKHEVEGNFVLCDSRGRLLTHQIDTWDTVNGKASLWVQLPTVPDNQGFSKIGILSGTNRDLASVSHVSTWQKGVLGAWNFSSPRFTSEATGLWAPVKLDGPTDYWGVVGDGLELFGSNENIDFGIKPNPHSYPSWTASLWYKLDHNNDIPLTGALLLSHESDDNLNPWQLILKNGGQNFDFSWSNQNMSGSLSSTIGIWHQLVVTADETSMRIYQDGKLVGRTIYTSGNGPIYSHQLFVGYRSLHPNLPAFKGLVDQIRIIEGSQSASEIDFAWRMVSSPSSVYQVEEGKTYNFNEFRNNDVSSYGQLSAVRFIPGVVGMAYDVMGGTNPTDLYAKGSDINYLSGGGVEINSNLGQSGFVSAPINQVRAYILATNQMTVEMWLTPKQLTATGWIVGMVHGDSGLVLWKLEQAGKNLSYTLLTSTGFSTLRTTNDVLTSTKDPFHVVLQYSPYANGHGGMSIYINGQQVAANMEAGNLLPSHPDYSWGIDPILALGNNPTNFAQPWRGKVFELNLYGHQYSTDYIHNWFNNSKWRNNQILPMQNFLGYTGYQRLLPVNARGFWIEDFKSDNSKIVISGSVYANGLTTQTRERSWLLYDIKLMQEIRGWIGNSMTLRGQWGVASGNVSMQIKVSNNVLAPSESEWINNSSGIIQLGNFDNAQTIQLNVSRYRWMWISVASSDNQIGEGLLGNLRMEVMDRNVSPDETGIIALYNTSQPNSGWLGDQSGYRGDHPIYPTGDQGVLLVQGGLSFENYKHKGIWQGRSEFAKLSQAIYETGELTLECVVRPSAQTIADTTFQAIFNFGSPVNSDYGILLGQKGSNLVFKLRTHNNLFSEVYTSTSVLKEPNTAYHIVATYKPYSQVTNEGGLQIYVNGILQKSNIEAGSIIVNLHSVFDVLPCPGKINDNKMGISSQNCPYQNVNIGDKIFFLNDGPANAKVITEANAWWVGFNWSEIPYTGTSSYGTLGIIKKGYSWSHDWVIGLGNRLFEKDKGWKGIIENVTLRNRYSEANDVMQYYTQLNYSVNPNILYPSISGNYIPVTSLGSWRDVTPTHPIKIGNQNYVNGLAIQNTSLGWNSLVYKLPTHIGEMAQNFQAVWRFEKSTGVRACIRTSTSEQQPTPNDWITGGKTISNMLCRSPSDISFPISLNLERAHWLWVGIEVSRIDSGLVYLAHPQITLVDEHSDVQPGLTYQYANGDWNSLPGWNQLPIVKKGIHSNFSLAPRTQSDHFAFAYKGLLRITTEGIYQFYLYSDDGSQLKIDGNIVVDNGGLHNAREKMGSVYLVPGDHAIELEYFEKEQVEGLLVSYSGPGIAKQKIPSNILFHREVAPQEENVSLPGWHYSYYEGSWTRLPNFSLIPVKESGSTALVDLNKRKRNDDFAFLFNAYYDITVPGIYKFSILSDDGSSLYIDGKLIVDNDGQHGVQERSGEVYLDVDRHNFEIRYFEKSGSEKLQVYWEGPGFTKSVLPENGFYHNPHFTQALFLLEPVTYSYFEGVWSFLPNFSSITPVLYGLQDKFSLAPRLRDDYFAFTMESRILIDTTGQYTFYLESDDGSQLWVNGQLLIDHNGLHAFSTKTAKISLTPGQHHIRLNYFEAVGDQGMSLWLEDPRGRIRTLEYKEP